MHLLLTRPETGEPDSLQAALLARGHRITKAPLLSIVLTGGMPSLDGVQALIATSCNGLRAVSRVPLTEAARALPLFAVGPATAALGRDLGFVRVIEGPGTGRELKLIIEAEVQPSAGALVHIGGDVLAVDLQAALEPAGFEVRREIVYRTEPKVSLPPEAAARLREKILDGVVLMSPRTARIYAKLVRESALEGEAREIVHYCLSEAVGRELADLDAVKVAVARSPNSEEMLALIAREASDSA